MFLDAYPNQKDHGKPSTDCKQHTDDDHYDSNRNILVDRLKAIYKTAENQSTLQLLEKKLKDIDCRQPVAYREGATRPGRHFERGRHSAKGGDKTGKIHK